LFNHLKAKSPLDKYRRLTPEQEELVLERAAALILAGAKRDTSPIATAVDNILLKSDLVGLLRHLKRNSPQEKYRRLTTEQEELVLENAAAMVLSGAKRDTGPIEKAVDQIFLKSDLAGLLSHLKRNSPQDKYRNLTTDQEEQVLEYATALVLSGAKKDTGPIEKAVNNVLGIS
jgi:hypothetical protein